MKTVIFDLDGTLADTSADLIAAANAWFVEDGLDAPLDAVADGLTAFHGGRAMLRLGLSRLGPLDEAEVERAFPRFVALYAERICVETRLYPGCREAVEALRAAGYALGVCTNKPQALAETLLERLGVRGYFGPVVGADTLPVRKPDPATYRAAVERAGGQTGRSLLLGDTETDVQTARAAGVPVVLVGFGPEGEAVARLAPDRLLPDYGALGRVVAELLG